MSRRPPPASFQRTLGALLRLVGIGRATSAKTWEERWRASEFLPPWEVFGDVAVLRDAVDDGWIPLGATVLDLGCGRGDAAAFLAERGMRVTGIDVADGAIALARARHQRTAGLSFFVHDVSVPLTLQPFDVLYDRGCFHGLRPRQRRGYLENVRAWTHRGSRFLLITHLGSSSDPKRREAEIRAIFEPSFICRDVHEVPMFRPGAGTQREGLAFRFERYR